MGAMFNQLKPFLVEEIRLSAHFFYRVFVAISLLTITSFAYAGDLEWSGLYRIEGQTFNNPLLDRSDATRKEYGVHTLILRPKIVAADGLYIRGQLNLTTTEENNQFGVYWGSGLDRGLRSERFRVTQFYLTHVQEFGSLLVGRAPVDFGLGITHNSGNDLFDHFADIRDLVGYKISMGNFFIFPMYAKITEDRLSGYEDMNEILVQLQYENPESDTTMGVMYQNRTAPRDGNEINVDALNGTDNGTTVGGGYNAKNYNVFYSKEAPTWRSAFELAQQKGDSGVSSNGREVSLQGFALATEFEYKPEGSKKSFGLKAGYVTGDDPSTSDEYEGFIFDQNYDVAMILFNHRLGRHNILNTGLIDPALRGDQQSLALDKPDIEALSNAYYVSPTYGYKWNDNWSMMSTLTFAWLQSTMVEEPKGTAIETKSNLGWELDLTLKYKVNEKITWLNQVGYYEPGNAWEVNGADSDSILGFTTKAAVSF